MKAILLISTILLIWPRSASLAEQEALTVGVVPQFEARKLADIWLPILARLEKESGIRLKFIGSKDIPSFEQGFKEGRFDIAYMNPYHAIVAERAQSYEPVIRDGERKLFGILVVKKSSEIADIAQLKDSSISFPSPNALGASLMIRSELQKRGTKFNAVYSGTHSSSYLNVLLGKTSAAGGVMGTFRQQKPEIRDRLKVIYETNKVHRHPIMIHPRVSEEQKRRLVEAFLRLAEVDESKQLLQKIPMALPVKTSLNDYLDLKSMNLEDFYQD